MNNCELCKVAATTFCESDQASLCWDCDAKVHGANFLVARHQRTLLCQACKSLTPWKASGATLGNTVSLCQRCVGGTRVNTDEGEESQGDNDDEIESLFDEDEEDEDDDDDDGDNQVVPLSSTATAPPACSSSCGEESVTRGSHGDEDVSESTAKVSLKRRREDNDLQEGSKRRYLYGGNRRERADLLTSDDEPPLNMSSPTAMGRINGSRGCCDIKESEDN